jgi:hypothetical protein
VRYARLSPNEALAILRERGCDPEGKTNREVFDWCCEHEGELPCSVADIIEAFFPGNPQRIRDELSER